MDEKPAFNRRRLALQIAFWFVLFVLLSTVLSNIVNVGNQYGQSAYGDDWDDLSAFKTDINDMGIETKSLVSSPLLLADIEDPANTTFIIAGVERDTISLPQFSSDGFLTFGEEDGYSPAEVQAIKEFVLSGGDVLVMDDFGYSGSIAEAFGVRFKGAQLQDTVYVTELDYNFIWMCMQDTPCGMDGAQLDLNTVENHTRWSVGDTGGHICKLYDTSDENDPRTFTRSRAGVCEHHWADGEISYNSSYRILTNNITAIDIIPNSKTGFTKTNILAVSSAEATIDINGDGEIWVGSEQNAETPDLWGQFNLSIEVCATQDCNFGQGGRITFIADGSVLTNALYDYEGYNDGEYGKVTHEVPANDNRKWAKDYIADSLVDPFPENPDEEVPGPAPNALVIFDESRHIQPSVASEGYNTVYFLLVYFTGEGLAMLLLFLILFITFEGVLLKKKDPEAWRHVFSIIYYGFGDANRYSYYAKSNKIKQVFLSKVRNQNGLTREEFDALPARELQGMINDPVLVKFVFENRNYSLEQTVAIVKRIKVWGRS